MPLLSIIEDPAARENLRAVVQQCQRELVVERGLKVEAQVLGVVQELLALSDGKLSIKEITSRFADIYQDECEYKVTAKWIRVSGKEKASSQSPEKSRRLYHPGIREVEN
ncbi:MAG: hypothetical protein WCO42_07355 [bacterium]